MANSISELDIVNGPVPEYFVTHIRTEEVEGHLSRIWAYKKLGSILELQYHVLVPKMRMQLMGQQCFDAAAGIQARDEWEVLGLTH